VPNQPLHRFKAEFFRAIGHPARIRILELLRPGELTVSELQVALEIEASSVSQQLAVLRAKHIVETRRAGSSVYYSVRDPQIFQLLDVARAIFNNHLIDLQSMLDAPASNGREPELTNGHELARVRTSPSSTSQFGRASTRSTAGLDKRPGARGIARPGPRASPRENG
jgi:DNA-binding transcriptional ArsR family regulator